MTWSLDSRFVAEVLPLLYGLAIGLLVGLERGWDERDERDGARVAGIRTFGLIGLLGALAVRTGSWLGPVLAGGVVLTLLLGYRRQSQEDTGLSATGSVAGLTVLGLGALAASGQTVAAMAMAAAVMFLLSQRQSLHGALKGMTAEEIRAAGRFAIIALILLPLMPDQGFGPLASVNPRQLLLVVVLVCGFSFAGYLATRRFGSRSGTLVTAASGAVVSSTAVTVALARKFATEPPATLSLGIAIASLISILRVLILTLLFAPVAFACVAMSAVPACLLLIAVVLRKWPATGGDSPAIQARLGNPLELKGALLLASLVLIASIASNWAAVRFGHLGPPVVLTVVGFADVDAAVLAFADLAPADQKGLASIALALPIAFNMLFKGVLTVSLARRQGLSAAIPLLISGVLVAAAALIQMATV